VLGETALPLGTPDADGRVWHVSQLPLSNLIPGEYALVITITAGNFSETRRAAFQVIE